MRETALTNSEWYVLDCLWERSPMSVMELVASLHDRLGWAKSTTITTLTRMEAKGLIRSEVQGRGKQIYPCVDRKTSARMETRSFLDRVYQGSVGLLVSALASEKSLSKEEIADLYRILHDAEEGAK